MKEELQDSLHWTHSRHDDGVYTVASLDLRRVYANVSGELRRKGWVRRQWGRVERWLAALQRRLLRWRRAGGRGTPKAGGG